MSDAISPLAFLRDLSAMMIADPVSETMQPEAGKRLLSGKPYEKVVATQDSDPLEKLFCDFLAPATGADATIESAIAALPSAGGTVHLCAGTYNISDTLNISKTDLCLKGSGWGTNIKVPTGAVAGFNHIVISATSVRVTLKDFMLTGNTSMTGGGDGITVTSGAVDTIIERVYVKNVKVSGINVQATGTQVLDCWSEDCGCDLYMSSADDSLVRGGKYLSTSSANTGEVIYCADSARVKLQGVYAEQDASYGEIVDWRVTDGDIIGCTFKRIGNLSVNGVIINAASTGGRFIGNLVFADTNNVNGAGVQANAASWTVMGNTFKWAGSQVDILVGGSAAYLTIQGNTGLGGTFVRIDDLPGPFIIAHNTVNGASLANLRATAANITNVVIMGNTVNTASGQNMLSITESGGFTIGRMLLVGNIHTGDGGWWNTAPTGADVKRYGNLSVTEPVADILNKQGTFLDFDEIAAPAAPDANVARLFAVDATSKTRLSAQFPSGAAQTIATEP